VRRARWSSSSSGQIFGILVSAGELLGFDDVVQRGEQHRDRPDLVADRPTQQVGVLVASTVGVPQLHEQIQRTGVGHRRR